ncbi:MAG TPA: OmpA family protein [Candidatus Angelobacter sp.]
MSEQRHLLLVVGFMMMTASVCVSQVNTAKPGEQAERHLSSDQTMKQWSLNSNQTDDVKRIKVCRVETVCKMRFKEGQTPRMRVKNLVIPLRYQDETIPISDAFTKQVKLALNNLRDKQGVTVRFIGYTDDAPLTGRDETVYGNALSLSKARAHRVALAMQGILGLPASAIESDGRGNSHPIASNATAGGRAVNRRVEVEFWYDDPLQDLPDEPQLCPDDTEETVTRVYDPTWGSIPDIKLENGQLIIPPDYATNLHRALADIADRPNARLRFIGYTKNERLDRRTASVYSDDIGLSAARARHAMDILMKDPLLAGAQSEHEGRGYVQSDDVVNLGFTQSQESFVSVQVVYDERLPSDNYEGVDITRQTRELSPKSPYDLNVMHITVDGKPIDDLDRSSSDVQRCTDVALDNANIRFQLDNLESRRRLAVAADPVAVVVSQPISEVALPVVHFRMYSNYGSFIKRAEIRIFDQQSLEAAPLAIIPVDDTGLAEWQPAPQILAGPARQLKYLLRAYDPKDHFDETDARPLWLYHEASSGNLVKSDMPPTQALLSAYGKNDLARQGITLGSGTVRVQGSGIPAGHTVWLAGRQVPVDPKGNFVAEEIFPNGTHTVEVAVLDDSGNGSLYLRDLEFKSRDLFFFGVADLTVSKNSVSAAEKLQQGDNATQPVDSSLDGQLAFYLNGKISQNWHLTASADTREGPVKDLFNNFLGKTPDELFRRINPDYYYPSFGDDGGVEETAPTMGKFYVKASHGQDYGMWGNFKVDYVGNDLAHVDRGLYGGDAHFGSEPTTSFGERRLTVDGFAAQPGTLPSYEAFLGTGGSIYFLHHQDILEGSESVTIEVRDKASNIVTGVVNLRPTVDYTIDYIQGRVLLSEALSASANDNLLVRTSGLGGDESFLVVRYEYTPGLDSLSQNAFGGQGSYWVNNFVKLGVTANSNDGDTAGNLGAADLTLRKSANSWFKVQAGRSTGLLSPSLQSNDGGFNFQGPDDQSFAGSKADAYRVDLSIGLNDFFTGHDGRFQFYEQKIDAGYTAPGQMTLKDTEQYGGIFKMPVTSRLNLVAKGDQRTEDQGLDTRAIELDLTYKLTNRWSFSAGARDDMRKDNSPVVPLTQEQGERTDAVAQVKFSPSDTWSAYVFGQDTIATSDGRPDNSRVGVGGSYRLTKRFKIDGEASDGDLGIGGKIGTTFLYSDRTSLYLNYSLENERTDNEELIQSGSWGNLVSGVKTRLSDSSSIYAEERYQTGAGQSGLTHATGINLVTKERWNFGGSAEFGKLFDSETGAATNRKAAGIHIGYGLTKIQFSSAVEFRRDDLEQPDLSHTIETVLLLRNNFKYQLSPSWRVLGKLDYSISNSTLGDFSTGGYTEGVVGYAFRPVRNDRLNALVKYTYFYNVPTADQLGAQNTATQFLQKSHIAALDVTYDLTTNWSVGGKYAYRLGEASLDLVQPTFFDDTAQLAVLRVDWQFKKQWDTLAEVRQLSLPDINQNQRGVLAAFYRRLTKNLKAGIGYNFTAFSDDLTDLNYKHKGIFFNLIGTK